MSAETDRFIAGIRRRVVVCNSTTRCQVRMSSFEQISKMIAHSLSSSSHRGKKYSLLYWHLVFKNVYNTYLGLDMPSNTIPLYGQNQLPVTHLKTARASISDHWRLQKSRKVFNKSKENSRLQFPFTIKSYLQLESYRQHKSPQSQERSLFIRCVIILFRELVPEPGGTDNAVKRQSLVALLHFGGIKVPGTDYKGLR